MKRWYDVLVALGVMLETDSVISSIYGDEIRLAGSAEQLLPSLHYWIVTDTDTDEIWSSHIVQFDQWTRSLGDLKRSSNALDELFNRGFAVTIAGVYMEVEYLESATLTTPPPSPDRLNIFGRAERYRFTPLRGEYLRGA